MNIIDDAAVGPHERVVHAIDEASGLHAVVAVHSTALGPAVGGTRFHPYAHEASAVIDVLRLAEGMTVKAAAAGLRVGGGKAVIVGDPARLSTPALWRAYAEVIDHLDGAYYAAEDVGTTVADMVALRAHTPFVLGLPGPRGGDGDPSPHTARGVLAAMCAAWEDETGASALEGARVVVQGAGKVGAALARMLRLEGARVWLSDVHAARAAALASEIGAAVLPPAEVLAHPCDILAPCALGGVLNRASVPSLRCRWVVGSANNQLSDDGVADLMTSAGIGYVPDFIANAGGLMHVCEQLEGGDAASGEEGDQIGSVVRELIASAREQGETTLAAAHRRAAERLVPAPVR